MNAEERLEKVREHLEMAFGHEMFELDEVENNEDKVTAVIKMHYKDKEMQKEFKFHEGQIISVKEVPE